MGDCSGRWDAGRIQQLLNNLVVNAIRYGEPTGIVRVNVQGTDAEAVLSVENSAAAIEPETLAHMFEPLDRGRDSARAADAGLGLGLYIANEIVQSHGGRITCASEGMQTVFTVHLPKR